MVKTWPSWLRRTHPTEAVLGEVVLGALLMAALAFTPRDAVPVDSSEDSMGPNVRFAATPVEQPSFGLALPGVEPFRLGVDKRGIGQREGAAADLSPAQLLIPSLRVHRAVEKVGTNRSRVMDLPVNAWNAGWYKGGPVPGAPGDAVIEGHAGYPDQPMIFGKLATLRPGDQILVVLSDGSRRLFLVASMMTVPGGTSPPGMAEPYGAPRLTLITCTGHFDDQNHFYSQRLAVELSYSGIV